MTHRDPQHDPQHDDTPIPRYVYALGVVLWSIAIAAMLSRCDAVSAATITPFELTLPNGQRIEACTASYDATAKAFAFGPCTTVFHDSFEATP